VKTSYVNGLAPYNRIPGKEYILEHDCYVFKIKDHDTSWPLIGAKVPGTPADSLNLPAEITEKSVGANLPNLRILDVVRSGARFKIVSVRRDEGRQGTHITFEILLLDEADRRYPRLDAFWIMDHSPEATGAPPRIIEDFAVVREKK
jgi:hypothetical protein